MHVGAQKTEEGTRRSLGWRAQGSRKKSRLFSFWLMRCVVIIGIFTLLQRATINAHWPRKKEKSQYPRSQLIHPTVEPSQEDLALPSRCGYV